MPISDASAPDDVLIHEGGSFRFRRAAGGRYTSDLRRTPVEDVPKRTHGLTPAEYQARYRPPVDYLKVASGYPAIRRELSLKLGLGRKKLSKARRR